MFNFDYVSGENTIEHNPSWSQLPDHPYRIILIIGNPGSDKINALLNLINHQPVIDKICLYAKDPHESRCQLLINNVKV